jgi:hypothetical protein
MRREDTEEKDLRALAFIGGLFDGCPKMNAKTQIFPPLEGVRFPGLASSGGWGAPGCFPEKTFVYPGVPLRFFSP